MDDRILTKKYKKNNIIMIVIVLIILSLTGCKSMVRSVAAVDNVRDTTTSSKHKNVKADESKNGITMSLSYGYSNTTKYGRYMNVKFNILSKHTYQKGAVSIILPNSDQDNLRYSKTIQMKANKELVVNMQVPITNNLDTMYVKIEDAKGKTLIDRKETLKLNAYNDAEYVGVLSDDSSGLSYLSNTDSKIFYLTEENIPEESLGLDTLDVILVDNFDTSKLDEKQVEAIKEWVKRGGTLVVGTGEYADKTLSFFENGFLNITTKELKSVKTNYNMDSNDSTIVSIKDKKNTENLQIINKNEDNRITKKVLTMSILNSKAILEDKGTKLMYSNEIGNGTVDIFTTNLRLESDEWDTIGNNIWKEIESTLSDSKVQQLAIERQGFTNEYHLFDAVTNPFVKKAPNIVWYVLILLIYVFFVGPILYLILKKMEKRELTWIIVPSLSILTTLIVFLCGSSTRIEKPYVGYVSVLEVGKNQVATEKNYFSITAPDNKSYNFNMNNRYNVAALSSSIYNYGYFDSVSTKNVTSYKSSVVQSPDETSIQVRNYEAFTPTYYKQESVRTFKGTIDSDLNYKDYHLYGTIQNNLGSNIKNAVVFHNNNVINVGNINNKEQIDISQKQATKLQSIKEVFTNENLIQKITHPKDGKKATYQESVEENALKYAIQTYLFGKSNTSYLIGFVDTNSVSEIFKDLKLQSTGVQLVVIPIEVNSINNDYETVYNIESYMSVVEGDYSTVYRTMGGKELTSYYNFDNDKKILSVDYPEELNHTFTRKTWDGFTGDIYFYNVITKRYDLIFNSRTARSAKQLENYLDKNNNLLVKYVVDTDVVSDNCTLPYLTIVREAN
ncbi:hypothetical protein [Anaeromicropila herbilytica]|uniref:Uncharacterized protein n=1 Tax=Anaeromicropila herbilytica TaxID=2785025 RepID=A0A7R7ENU8_9FIRM|nr:hypothetical protein [Anaeromicropila herbilytica]BCN32233.1 hypothetical protein bsdtb5_35280 [Anaeromicropila herbilytica]